MAFEEPLPSTPPTVSPTPLMLSTWSFGVRANTAAWPTLSAGGSALDAVETACVWCENDPEVDSVGYGGLPDREGRMTLDGCIMSSPTACGSVCALRAHRHPVSIARTVMDQTPHVMLAGSAADEFASTHGHRESELCSPRALAAWTAWRERTRRDPEAGTGSPRPFDENSGGQLFGGGDREERWKDKHDTIGVLAIDARGTLAGACSTSGMPWKVPGRVGDSPIIGHGLYVDPQVGAAVATGTGELVMAVCGSFLAVERMRGGDSPETAIAEVLTRISSRSDLDEDHQVGLLALRPDGRWAAASLRPGFRLAVSDGSGHHLHAPGFVMCPGT